MFNLSTFAIFFIASITGGALSFVILRMPRLNEKEIAEKAAKAMIQKEKEADEIMEEGKKQAELFKKQSQEQNERFKNSLDKLEKMIQMKENAFQKRLNRNNEIQQIIQKEQSETREAQINIKQFESGLTGKLIERTDLTLEQAKESLIRKYTEEVKELNETRLAKITEETKEEAAKIANNIIIQSIHRFSAPTSVEGKSSNITVHKDLIKGQIVGKDGTQLEKLEQLLEVDIIFNDLPQTITVSGGEPMKRHIAVLSIEKLVKLKNMDWPKIENCVKEARRETEKSILEDGKRAAKSIGLKIVPEELIKLIGRLKFRTSYGQNILKHALEVAAFSAMIGAEIGADIEVCKFAGFLHDIGKSIDYEVEGSHDAIGKDILEKFNYPPEIIHAVYAHHEIVPLGTPEAFVVKIADAISAGRPGARQESLERYLTRLSELEDIANKIEGVQKSYAISAGREIRVIVNPEMINDEQAAVITDSIVKNIERQLNYPGKIKVNVIRRTVSTDYAK